MESRKIILDTSAFSAFLRNQETPVPSNDAWIAASAMEHGLIVVTTDRHYLNIPQVITEFYK